MVEHYEFGRLMAAEMMNKEANSLVKGLFNNARRGVQAVRKFKPQTAMKTVQQAAPAAAEAAESAAKSGPSMMQTARRMGAKAMGRTRSIARGVGNRALDAVEKGEQLVQDGLPKAVNRAVAKGMGRAKTVGRAGAAMASQAGSDIARGARVARNAAGRAMGPTARKIVKNPAVQAGAGGAAAGLAAGGMLGGSGGGAAPAAPAAASAAAPSTAGTLKGVGGAGLGGAVGLGGLAGLADQLKGMNPTARNALLGGGAGALAGGLYGLVNPGEDSKGRQKSRLMSALQNAALMGGVGAGVGGGAGYAGYGM